MPAYKDEKRGTWYASFYYQDWTGERKLKKKRGFAKKKDALEFEREFLSKNSKSCASMKFKTMVEIYLEHGDARKRKSTQSNQRNIIKCHILPYFGEKNVDEIGSPDIIKWQDTLLKKGYKPTYLRTINSKLSSIFNFAARHYGLAYNPCHKVKMIGSKKPETVDFWTPDEFEAFISQTKNKPRTYTIFNILYWSGIRSGELLALTPRDYLRDKMALRINKTYQVVDGEEITGPPKTLASERIVTIPAFLGRIIEDYMDMLYECPPDVRLFEGTTKHYLSHEMNRFCEKSGVKRIRVHDIRHSHASLLIDMGYSDRLIAERLGHEDLEYIRQTYGHLFPSKHVDAIEDLENLESGFAQRISFK